VIREYGGLLIVKRAAAAITILLVLVSCRQHDVPLRFAEILDVPYAEISRIEMVDGSTGAMRQFVDRGQVEKFFGLLETLEYIPKSPQRASTGYIYYADLYSGTHRLVRLTFGGDAVEMGGTRFGLDRNVSDQLDEFYSQGLR
jgi:hypothetical protein